MTTGPGEITVGAAPLGFVVGRLAARGAKGRVSTMGWLDQRDLQRIKTDPAQECQELLGALSDHVSMLRERAARGDDDAESVLTTIMDTLYSELMTVRELDNGSGVDV